MIDKKKIYVKLLFITTEDLNLLKAELLDYNYKLSIISKKDLKKLNILQYSNSCFIYSINEQNNNFKAVITLLEKIEYIQILGVIEKNILLPNTEKVSNFVLIFNLFYFLVSKEINFNNIFLKVVNNKKEC